MNPASGSDESKASREIFCFEDFELDRGIYQLRRAGHPVRLQRLPLELLYFLVERRGELVTREEIIERLWGKSVFVDSENSINTAVHKIRAALNDDADAPRFIITVPARGYRFVAPIREVGHTPPVPEASSVSAVVEASPSADAVDASSTMITKADMPLQKGQRRGILWSIGGIAFVIAVIVLFLLGIVADVGEGQHRNRGHHRRPYHRPLQTPGPVRHLPQFDLHLQRQGDKVQQVGRQLGAQCVLEGSVRKADNQVRVTAQLVDAATGDHL